MKSESSLTVSSAPRVGNLIGGVLGMLEGFPMSILQLLLRLGIASVFFKSGLVKIESWQSTVFLFKMEYKVPVIPYEAAAYMSAAVELATPVLLVLGLATRLATLPLLGMTVVIEIFVFPESWSEHLIWAAILLVLLCRGPGQISLDRLVGPWFKERLGI